MNQPTRPLTTHLPGPGGLFDRGALCGATCDSTATGSMRMSETAADCAVCLDLEAGA